LLKAVRKMLTQEGRIVQIKLMAYYLLGVCCLGLVSIARADWPEFRGPTAQGIVQSAKTPLQWSKQKGVVWRTELPGEGWSSPVVVGSRIYLTAAIPKEGSPDKPDFDLSLLILDRDSGELVKTVSLFLQSGKTAPAIHKKNSHASPTPVFDGEQLYVHFGHQGTACTSLSGDVIWRNDLLEFPPVHGNGGSPVVVNDLLIFSRDGANVAEVVALDKATGKVRWQTPREVAASKQFSFCTPLVLSLAGKMQLILPGSNVVQSLDPQTGAEHWRVTYDGYSVIPRPIYHQGLVYVCTGYDRPSLLAIDPTGQGDVTATHLRWQIDTNVPHTPSLVAHAGQVTMISDRGIASSVDAATGKELWKERIGGNYSASPLLIGNQLLLISEEGDCTILGVDGKVEVLGKSKMEERCLASPAVVGNDLLIRTDKAWYRIGSPNAR
jgi:outer membrane protein assembly factor BamB